VTYFKFGDPIDSSGMAEARVVKFCTQLGYVKSYQIDDTLPLKMLGGHMTY